MEEIQNSIDCVIFGFERGKLKVLLIKRKQDPEKGIMALPGDFIDPVQDLDQNAERILKEITSLDHIFLEQIKAFGKTNRYPGVRVITIGYLALINISKYQTTPGHTAEELEWCPIEKLPELAFDHDDIIKSAFQIVKHQVRLAPIGFNLLPETFSLTELQQLYEAILQIPLNKRNFRNKINQMKVLVDSGQKQTQVAHKPAKLYRFDQKVYDRLKKEGFFFKV